MPLPRLILASESRHRANLLHAVGLGFEALASGVDEAEIKAAEIAKGAPLKTLAMTLALAKAQAVSADHREAHVLGGDQVLLCEGRLFDKPKTMDEARQHLRFLAGKTHTLETAAVVCRGGETLWQGLTRPQLTMRTFSEDVLEAYLDKTGDEILTSVGAYQIEGLGLTLFEAVEGDTFSIQGLPLIELLKFLRQEGLVAS